MMNTYVHIFYINKPQSDTNLNDAEQEYMYDSTFCLSEVLCY